MPPTPLNVWGQRTREVLMPLLLVLCGLSLLTVGVVTKELLAAGTGLLLFLVGFRLERRQ